MGKRCITNIKMNFSIKHITKAFELSRLPEFYAEKVISNLPEAVRQTRLIQPDNLDDLFEWFCFEENISERELKSHSRKKNLVELRLKFSTLSKVKFGKKATQQAIGKVLNRDHASVLRYLRIVKARSLKGKKVNKLSSEIRKTKDSIDKNYEFTQLVR
jgi:chromosomal replication initiation ATPase DnaA